MKHRGDIAEQAVVLRALKRGWSVLLPVGDNLPYDMVFDIKGRLVKVQVKSAWLDSSSSYVVDHRRTKSNRKRTLYARYKETDFDFALVFLPKIEVFYVFPVAVLLSFAGNVHMREAPSRNGKPRSFEYREAWDLIGDECLEETGSDNTCRSLSCPRCGQSMHKASTKCHLCENTSRKGKVRTKIEWPSTAELLRMLSTSNFSRLATQLGVSDNAIRKRIRNYPS